MQLYSPDTQSSQLAFRTEQSKRRLQTILIHLNPPKSILIHLNQNTCFFFATVFPWYTVLTAFIQNWTVKEEPTNWGLRKVSEPSAKLKFHFKSKKQFFYICTFFHWHSQTCLQRPALGLQNCGLCRQVVIVQRLSYLIKIEICSLKLGVVVNRWSLFRGGR